MSTYVPPPPPPPSYGQQRSSDSCFKWGALSCGGCIVLLVLAGVFIWFTAGKFIGGAMKDSMQVAIDMTMLRRQIMKYKEDTGKYPDKLDDLVPKYVASTSALKLSTHPEGPEYTYHKPGPNAEPDEVLLEYKLTVTTPDGEKVEVPVRMLINGQTRQGSTKVTPGGRRSGFSPSGQPATSGGE